MPAGTSVHTPISLGKIAGSKVLPAAEYLLVKGLFVPPGYHRLYNAVGLSLGLFLGRQMMNVIVGHKPDGTPLEKESVPLPLRPLHGLIQYNPYGDDPHDRWMKVADNLAPALFGAIGAMAGSSVFFTQNIMKATEILKLEGDAVKGATLWRTESAMAMEKSKPWWVAAGATSLFGSASMLNWLYGFTLGVNFMMRSGRKAFMGMDMMKWFSNTQATHPSGPIGLANDLIHMISHNRGLGNPEAEKLLQEQTEGLMHYLLKSAPANLVKDAVDFMKAEAEVASGECIRLYGKYDPEKVAGIFSKRFEGGQFEHFLHKQGIIKNPGDAIEYKNVFNLGNYGVLDKPATMVKSIRDTVDKQWEQFAKGSAMRIANPHTGIG